MSREPRPLQDVVVVDASRMLPGAVMARTLVELGARLIKVEDPRRGDPLRHTPPQRGGISVGFSVFYRGTESIGLDLRTPAGVAAMKCLCGKADVLIESFRPGTLARWGLDPDALQEHSPRLTVCSLPGFPPGVTEPGTSVGHDLNFVALSGLLHQVQGKGGSTVPGAQLADVSTGLLGAMGVLAALLERAATGRGRVFRQPIAAGPLPFMAWRWADAEAGSSFSMTDTIIGGAIPAYRVYRCGDDLDLAVGCLEPKFWVAFCAAVGRPDLAAGGLDTGPAGVACGTEMAEHLARQPRAHWLSATRGADLPVTALHSVEDARNDPMFAQGGLLEDAPMADGTRLRIPGPALPEIGRTPHRPPPTLGEHTAAVAREFGFDAD